MMKVAALFAAIAVLFLAYYKYDSSQAEEQVVAAEAAMKNALDNNLAKGASPEQLDAILDAQGATHMYLRTTGIEGADQGPFGSPMHQCTLGWKFEFDQSERLARYSDNALCKNTITAGTRDFGEPMRPGVDQPVPKMTFQ
jgi:hypothetical protein